MEEIALAVVPHDADDADASVSERNSESGSEVYEEYEWGVLLSETQIYLSVEKVFLVAKISAARSLIYSRILPFLRIKRHFQTRRDTNQRLHEIAYLAVIVHYCSRPNPRSRSTSYPPILAHSSVLSNVTVATIPLAVKMDGSGILLSSIFTLRCGDVT